MNQLVTAIKALDTAAVSELIKQPRWSAWSESTGKNALHYLCGSNTGGSKKKSDERLKILRLLLKDGLDINSVHRIEDENCDFPATPLWYAYTKGRNEKLYKYLLKNGADPSGCWWAIASYDDVKAAELWLKHGAVIDEKPSLDELFLGAFRWKKYRFAFWSVGKGADVDARGPAGLTA